MFKVLDVYKIGDMISVSLHGNCEMIKNGTKLKDKNNRIYNVISVAMTSYNENSPISNNLIILLNDCDIKTGAELYLE